MSADQFATLDGLVGRIKGALTVQAQVALVEAARQAGSVEAMPEPFKSWLFVTDLSQLPDSVREPGLS